MVSGVSRSPLTPARRRCRPRICVDCDRCAPLADVIMAFAALFFYSYNVFIMGLTLIPFILNLIASGKWFIVDLNHVG